MPPTAKPKPLPGDGTFTATYRLRSTAAEIEARATGIAVEQSVEMPVAAIDNAYVKDTIIGRVEAISDFGGGLFEARIALSEDTVGSDPGQLLNMLFGNTSIHEDVSLVDVALPASLLKKFGGPRHGLPGLRKRVGAEGRAMTGSALKPQGLPPEGLAALAGRLTEGGLDYIKDDHGLAEQAFSPFSARVPAVARAMRAANARTGRKTRYLPSLSGTLDSMRGQLKIVREEGVDGVVIAPMITGVASFHALVTEHPDIAFITHPALAGGARIAPPVHFGRLFRLFGADGVVYPNFGGRFSYSQAVCRAITQECAADWGGLMPVAPIPAGGMTAERVPELLEFYGRDVMLLIGGGLLSAGANLTAATAKFVEAVEGHRYS